MPEAVFDKLGRRWVMLAPERAKRGTTDQVAPDPDPAPCDFCAGREANTPEATYTADGPDGWIVRAFPNLYPGTPFHEVIVHGPAHDVDLRTLERSHRLELMRAYRDRTGAAGTTSVVPAFNRGHAAGASRSHEHSQIFGLDLVPPVLQRECEAFSEDPCVLCSMVTSENTVSVHGGFAVIVNPAPQLRREMIIVGPHRDRFTDSTDADLDHFGACMADALTRVQRLIGQRAASNMVIHTPPDDCPHFHWHAHLYPRTAVFGALEVGAEMPLVSADPPRDAEDLRGALPWPRAMRGTI